MGDECVGGDVVGGRGGCVGAGWVLPLILSDFVLCVCCYLREFFGPLGELTQHVSYRRAFGLFVNAARERAGP